MAARRRARGAAGDAATRRAWSRRSGVKVRVRIDARRPDAGRLVYLFKRSGSLSPGAGKQYVNYTSTCCRATTRRTYKLQDGPNPENSTVTTPYYSHHFADRWLDDQLRVTAAGASGVDILDRHKALFAPGQLRAQRGHVRRRRGRVHRQQERPGARDPLLHRRQQRPAHAARAHLLRPPRGHPHLPARARDPGRAWTLRLLAGRHRHDLPQRPRTRAA